MAISSLSTLSTTKFKGGAHLAEGGTPGLVASLNAIITKINQIIAGIGDGSLDTLIVGTTGGGAYYGTSDSWFWVDGTNPPTLARLRFLDEGTGGYREVRVVSGVLGVV